MTNKDSVKHRVFCDSFCLFAFYNIDLNQNEKGEEDKTWEQEPSIIGRRPLKGF